MSPPSLLHAASRRRVTAATVIRAVSLARPALAGFSLLATPQRLAAASSATPASATPEALPSLRSLSTIKGQAMASDEDYMAFLDKANQDADGGRASTQQQSGGANATFKALDEGSSVPKAIKDISPRPFYVSDADEPFEHVSLRWDGEGGLPDQVEFAKLIHHWDAEKADVEIMDPAEWDARGQYTEIIKAVREATKGNDVRVYRVGRDKTRVEYWVVSAAEGRIVGMKALAIES